MRIWSYTHTCERTFLSVYKRAKQNFVHMHNVCMNGWGAHIALSQQCVRCMCFGECAWRRAAADHANGLCLRVRASVGMCASVSKCMSERASEQSHEQMNEQASERTKTHGKDKSNELYFLLKLIHYVVTLWQEKSLHETFIYDVTKNIYTHFLFVSFRSVPI